MFFLVEAFERLRNLQKSYLRAKEQLIDQIKRDLGRQELGITIVRIAGEYIGKVGLL